ncbi:MAG: FMN-binding protein [Thermoleophilaceae bacterium]
MINSQAAPQLRGEALRAQSAQMDVVSGATYTSEAYARSLQAALVRARA